jgi:phosphatidylglycerol:prolipoprotein diacylglycerol transferase
MAISYPHFDPIAFQIGPLAIRWYGLSYVAGILLAWYCCHLLIKKKYFFISSKDFSDFMPWATLGVVVGGRLGHVLFYGFTYYWEHPLEIFMIWHPGMSFHGGLLGVCAVMISFSYKRHLSLLDLGDVLSVGVPIGLFFGRLANFVNGELFGRITDVSWGMVFPQGGPWPRHPSQLYEAFLEGVLLFFLMLITTLLLNPKTRKPGFLTGLFLIGYSVGRFLGEYFREPEVELGLFSHYITYGQLLSLPLALGGLYLMIRSNDNGHRTH